MKYIHYFKYLTVLLYIWTLSGSPIPVLAEQSGEVDFAIKAVLPDNQIDQNHTYFDLLMKASQKQTVQVEIWNLTDKELQLEAQVHSATTNENGVVEYGKRDILPDDTLLYQMEELISCDSLVTVPANGKALYELHIQMPEKKYKGILAGGVTFQLAGNYETGEVDDEAVFAVQNTYSYVIGIVLRENKKEMQPELMLNEIFYGEQEGIVMLSANIQNIMAAYADDLEVEARITRKATTGTLYQTSKEDMRMAPNSNFDFQVDLKGNALNEGEFTLYIRAATAEKEWNWEKDFTIDADGASVKVYDQKTTKYRWLFAAVPAVLFVSGIALYRYQRVLNIKRNTKKTIMKKL